MKTWIHDFDDKSIRRLARAITRAQDSGEGYIVLHIATYGGDAHGVFAMLDLLQASRLNIVTVAVGRCMSAGSLLLASGSKGHRFIAPNAVVMVHELRMSGGGGSTHMIGEAAEMKRMNDHFLGTLDTCTKRPKNYWAKQIRVAGCTDLYFDAEQAVAAKLADVIGMPVVLHKAMIGVG